MSQILPYLLCSALYAGVAALLMRIVSVTGNAIPLAPRALHFAGLAPLVLHTVLLAGAIFAGDRMYLGVGSSVSLIIWLTVLIYWTGGIFYRLEGLEAIIFGAAAVLVWAPLLLPSVRPLAHTDQPAFYVHLMISMLASSLFTIAALQALMMAALERRLHGGRLPAFLLSLPPLLTMETLLFRFIAVGFVLLSLTLFTGMVFSEELFGQPLKFNHKVVFGILSWAIFAALLAGRQIYGWRGRRALRYTIAGFVALILAYIGSKFVLEIVLHR
ncbi:MAG: cytochrome C biogenesis protein [Proteobacteria bacterium]|nr:MAG: cytochrome C biogenesis protein [Pseudomonadota bacterium]